MQNTAQIIQFPDFLKTLDEKLAGTQHKPLTAEERAAFEAEKKAMAARDYQAMEVERQQLRLNSVMGRAAIPKRFHNRLFENYQAVNDGQKKALADCQMYASRFGELDGAVNTGMCLILCGLPGTGKTHLATAISHQLIKDGYSSLCVAASDYIRRVRETWSRESERTENQVITSFAAPDLLVIDEIGASHGTESEQVHLFELINKRYEEQKPTIVISNLNREGIAKVLGDRAMDRLREGGGKLIAFTWDSARRQAKSGEVQA